MQPITVLHWLSPFPSWSGFEPILFHRSFLWQFGPKKNKIYMTRKRRAKDKNIIVSSKLPVFCLREEFETPQAPLLPWCWPQSFCMAQWGGKFRTLRSDWIFGRNDHAESDHDRVEDWRQTSFPFQHYEACEFFTLCFSFVCFCTATCVDILFTICKNIISFAIV